MIRLVDPSSGLRDVEKDPRAEPSRLNSRLTETEPRTGPRVFPDGPGARSAWIAMSLGRRLVRLGWGPEVVYRSPEDVKATKVHAASTELPWPVELPALKEREMGRGV